MKLRLRYFETMRQTRLRCWLVVVHDGNLQVVVNADLDPRICRLCVSMEMALSLLPAEGLSLRVVRLSVSARCYMEMGLW